MTERSKGDFLRVLRKLEKEKDDVDVDVSAVVLSGVGAVVVGMVSAKRSDGERRRRAIINFT